MRVANVHFVTELPDDFHGDLFDILVITLKHEQQKEAEGRPFGSAIRPQTNVDEWKYETFSDAFMDKIQESDPSDLFVGCWGIYDIRDGEIMALTEE